AIDGSFSRTGKITANLRVGENGKSKPYYESEGKLHQLQLPEEAVSGWVNGCPNHGHYFGRVNIFCQDRAAVWDSVDVHFVCQTVDPELESSFTCATEDGRLLAVVKDNPPYYWLINEKGKMSSGYVSFGLPNNTSPVSVNSYGTMLFEIQPDDR